MPGLGLHNKSAAVVLVVIIGLKTSIGFYIYKSKLSARYLEYVYIPAWLHSS